MTKPKTLTLTLPLARPTCAQRKGDQVCTLLSQHSGRHVSGGGKVW